MSVSVWPDPESGRIWRAPAPAGLALRVLAGPSGSDGMVIAGNLTMPGESAV